MKNLKIKLFLTTLAIAGFYFTQAQVATDGTVATGQSASAIGSGTQALGDYSTAMGDRSIASGKYSVAMGYKTEANDFFSFASGYRSIADENGAFAHGFYAKALGKYSIAIGDGARAERDFSLAIGNDVTALQQHSFVLGSGSSGNNLVNNIANSLMIGFNSTIPTLFVGGSSGSNTTGKVGIGTTSPSYKLQVQGDIYANGGWLRVSGNRGIYFQSHGGGLYMTDNTWIRTYGSKSFYHNTGVMRTDGTFQVGPGGNRFVVNTSGNVGIGVTSPGSKLHIKITSSGKALQLIGLNKDVDFHMGHNGSSYGFYWRYKGTGYGNNNALELWANNQASTDKQVYNITQDGNINFKQNVGIGTTNTSDAKLTVKGKIIASEIEVLELSEIPDYVFKKDYELMSIKEVETFIEKYRHLPNMKSEKEILEEGKINIGEFQLKLLEKIEELTLYVIDLQKQIDNQNEVNVNSDK